MEVTKNYYVVITANILYNKDLSSNEKILVAMISNLSNEKGYCWASNSYFAEALGCDERTIRRYLTNLEEKIGLGRIMQLDEKGNEYFRILVLPDGVNQLNKVEDKNVQSPGQKRPMGSGRKRPVINKELK